MDATQAGGYLDRPAPSSLADVVEIVLDKGVVIDAYARVSLVGIEVLTLDARIVVASVDTYLRFAEATNRLDLEANGPPSLVDVLEHETEQVVTSVASHVVEDKVEGALDKVGDTLGKPAEKVVRTAGRKVAGAAASVAAKAVHADDE
jgi:gas vesicle structural protein